MKSRALLLNVVLFLAVVLAACGGAATQEVMMEKPQESMMEEKPEEPAAEPTHDAMMEKPAETASTPDPMSAPAEEAMMDTPAWFGAPLSDVRTGQTFSVDDFKGKVVLVETMAVWCTTCLRQQGEVKALHEQLGARDDFVSIGLDIDPNENAEALKTYVEDKGFDWLYTVPPTDVSREIASLYGDQFLNPPSAPMFVIDRKGDAHPLPFGVKSVDDLRQAIQPLLDESM